MKITCNVIRDLADLYIDNLLSEDSKILVEEHIATCDKCRVYVEKSKAAFEATPALDVEKVANEKANIKGVKKSIMEKLVPIAILIAMVSFVGVMLVEYFLYDYEVVIPYDGESVYVTEEGLMYFPDCYDVVFFESNSQKINVHAYTTFVDVLRGVEPNGEYQVVDLKEFDRDGKGIQVIYKEKGAEDIVVWDGN